MKEINNTNNQKKHLLTGPWIRLFARAADFIFISIFSFCLSLMVFINSEFTVSDLFKEFIDTTPPYLESWRLLLMIIILFVCIFFYFCLIPYLTKGYTLFKYVFKIRLWTKMNHKNFFWLIFKHEFLIWFFMLFFMLMFGIFCISVPDPIIKNERWSPAIMLSKFLFSFDRVIFNNQTPEWVKLYFGLATFTKTMLACSGMIPAVLFMYMLFHKNKKAPQDIVSETFVYYLNRFVEEKKVETKSIQTINENISLPGINESIKGDNTNTILQDIYNKKIFDKLIERKDKISELKEK